MIQANELRIGNWVEWVFPNRNNQPNKFQFCEIESIRTSLVGVLGSAYGYDQIQPIPLTPEILEKCNIERIGNLANSATRKFYKIGKITIELISKNRIAVYIDSPTELILISFQDYLHQLQNLYFALTGEELTFKP